MRKLPFAFLTLTTLLLAGCGGRPPDASENASGNGAGAAQDYFTVRAGPVADARIGSLSGTFQMLKVSQANGIPSDGRGGACLIFPAADLGFTEMAKIVCSSNSDCTHLPPDGTAPGTADFGTYSPDPSNPAHKENRFGYCEQSTRKCWSKPIGPGADAAVCNRPLTMTPATLNPVPAIPPGGPGAPANVAPFGIKSGAKVRVVACIQQTGAKPGLSPNGTGCASNDGPDRIEDWGPEATIHP